MAEPLTKLESSVYHYLLDFTAERTYQPSIRDIGKQFKIKSTKTFLICSSRWQKKAISSETRRDRAASTSWVLEAHCALSPFPTTVRFTLASRR